MTYTRSGDWAPGDGKHVHLRLDGGPTKMDFNTDGDNSYMFADVPGGRHTLEAVVADSSHVEQSDSADSESSDGAPDTSPPAVSVSRPSRGFHGAELGQLTATPRTTSVSWGCSSCSTAHFWAQRTRWLRMP